VQSNLASGVLAKRSEYENADVVKTNFLVSLSLSFSLTLSLSIVQRIVQRTLQEQATRTRLHADAQRNCPRSLEAGRFRKNERERARQEDVRIRGGERRGCAQRA